jgi:hypothetical protein
MEVIDEARLVPALRRVDVDVRADLLVGEDVEQVRRRRRVVLVANDNLMRDETGTQLRASN